VRTALDRLGIDLTRTLEGVPGNATVRRARALTHTLFDTVVGDHVEIVGVRLAESPGDGTAMPGMIAQMLVPNGLAEAVDLGSGWTFTLRAGTDLAQQLAVVIGPVPIRPGPGSAQRWLRHRARVPGSGADTPLRPVRPHTAGACLGRGRHRGGRSRGRPGGQGLGRDEGFRARAQPGRPRWVPRFALRLRLRGDTDRGTAGGVLVQSHRPRFHGGGGGRRGSLPPPPPQRRPPPPRLSFGAR